MAKLLLGFNGNCFTNRYDEPQEWARICNDLGIKNVMFNIDLIDPYWPWNLQKKMCDDTLEACAKYGVRIFSSFGGHHGHQHYLGNPILEARREAEEFFKRAIKQTAYLGGRSFGTCFSILTMRCNNNPVLRSEIIEDAIGAYQRLADYADSVGLPSLAYEMTSVERESCATFAENDYVLERLKDAKVPMRVCLDLGHRNMNGLQEEADHLAWIRRYGMRCDVIDCQQSDLSASHHWPFTPENNARGVIKGEEIIQAVEDSGAEHEILLAFELRSSAFYPYDDQHLEKLSQSVDYWRNFICD